MFRVSIYTNIDCLDAEGSKKPPQNLEEQADNLKRSSCSRNYLSGLLRVKREKPVFSKGVILCEEPLLQGGTGAEQPSLTTSKRLSTSRRGGVLIHAAYTVLLSHSRKQ